MTDTNEQPAVPLPEPSELYLPTHVFQYYESDDLRAYGEACAAHWRDSAMRLFKAEQEARHERDEWKARAEAAEAKIAELGVRDASD